MKHPFYLFFSLILALSIVGQSAFAKKKHKNNEVAAAAIATALIVAGAKAKQQQKHHRGYKYDDYKYNNHWDYGRHGNHDKKSEKIAAGVAAAAIATAVVVAAAKNKGHQKPSYNYGPDSEWDPVYKSVVRYPKHNVKCFDNTRLCYWTTDSGLLKDMSKKWTEEVY